MHKSLRNEVMISYLPLGVTVLLLAACAAVDARKRTIPHIFVIGLVVTAAANSILNGGWAVLGYKESLVMLAVGFLLYYAKCMGAGDVKMLAAVALWFPGGLLPLAFWISLCGGALALGYAIKRLKTGLAVTLPYGLAIAIGSVICFALTRM
jgi:prepilin peptidase CpaA